MLYCFGTRTARTWSRRRPQRQQRPSSAARRTSTWTRSSHSSESSNLTLRHLLLLLVEAKTENFRATKTFPQITLRALSRHSPTSRRRRRTKTSWSRRPSQSFQHFEADSGVESIESLSPKETTSSPIYSPAGNTEVLMTPQMSNVQTQNPILTSLLSVAFSSSSSQASSSSGSGPNAAAVANSNPLLTTLLNNTSQQSTTVQAWSSLDKEESLALPDNFRLKQ